MNHIIAAVAAPAVLAASGIAGTAPAQAAPTVFYQHGTTHQVSYATYAQCAPHAATMTKLAVGKKALLRSAKYSDNLQDAKRTFCYPAASGRWSYLVVYRSAKGHPLAKGDKIVSMKNRDSKQPTVDTENVWIYDHYVEAPVKKFSGVVCDKRLHNLTNLVRASTNFRLGYTTAHCSTDDGWRSYEVGYLGTRGGNGYWKDHGFKLAVPMLDLLGYDDPGLPDDGTVQATPTRTNWLPTPQQTA